MPVTPTHPGVYIEEIPSGVRTITGVATSLTAFVGRAQRGPVNAPVTITSYADFQRIFGGLWLESTLGNAVRDFYLNGGSQAIIVRLHNTATAANLNVDTLVLEAANPGAWGNHLRVRVDHDVLGAATTFNLSIKDDSTGQIELFRNVSIDPTSVRRVDQVLADQSALVRVTGALPEDRPAAHPAAGVGEDAWATHTPATNTTVADADQGSDGDALSATSVLGSEVNKTGLYALDNTDLFNLLCIPPYTNTGDVDATVTTAAAVYCEKRRAILLVDPPTSWSTKDTAKAGVSSLGTTSKNAAVFFPRLTQPNLLKENQLETFAPCGAVAGVIARIDAQRGLWKASAGVEATLTGVPQLSVPLTDAENGELNPLGINCLRSLPAVGPVVWGARTLQGDDRLASEWKYLPVRRLALYIEESLYRGTQWVVFEPNDEPLWSQIRLNLGAFMRNLFRQGAFAGQAPKDAYFVKCDKETTTQHDINQGIVNIVVGFAPLKPAEFVIIQLQQMAGQVDI